MKFFSQKRIAAAVIIGILFVLFGAIATYNVTVQYQNTLDNISLNNKIQTNLNSLFVGLLNAETGQRGYVITGNSTYLAPYNSALTSIVESNNTLKNLIPSGSNLSISYNQLQPLIQAKLTELNQTIVIRQTQGFAGAQAVVNNGLGILYMDQIRGVIGTMSANVTQTISKEESLAASQSAQRLNAAYFDATIAVGGILFARYAANSNFEKEKRARREAELLQDILTHDIRNFNQVSKMSADILYDKFNYDPEAVKIISSLSNSIDGSTELVDRAKKLGRIISEGKVKLTAVEIVQLVEKSTKLVRDTTRDSGKTIVDELKVLGKEENRPTIWVMADELLEEVFVNLFSNSVKFSEGQKVIFQTRIDNTEDGHYWRISISDFGRGIPDDQKKNLFERYQKTSTGRGLGMSIVHALVVERYRGKVKVSDRVNGDYRQGTTIDLWLPKAIVNG
jgi:signal transduction histidine kinase